LYNFYFRISAIIFGKQSKWENGMANYSLLTTDLTEKTLRQTSHFSNEWLKLENAFKNQRNQ